MERVTQLLISGFVKNFDASDPQKSMDVTIVITAPNGNLVTVLQISPSSDGNYSDSFTAGGMISAEGDYTVKAKWGAQSNQTVFKYGGSSGAPVVEEDLHRTNTSRSNRRRTRSR